MRYIVGVDGSAPADAAVRWAEARALRDEAGLELVHVVDDEAGLAGSSYRREAEQLGGRLLSAVAARTRRDVPDLDVSVRLLEGPVPWELAKLAGPDDVLVIGTHKTGYNNGRVLGTRGVQVAIAAHGPVAIIPATDARFRRDVVAGIDREETAAAIAEVGAREAAARGEELILVHAGPAAASGTLDDAPLVAALAHVRRHHPGLVVRARRSSRPPTAALLDIARTKALLVIGPGSTGLSRSPIGTVLHEVLVNANSAVLVAGPDRRPLAVAASETRLDGGADRN